jgi:hypothetical protein
MSESECVLGGYCCVCTGSARMAGVKCVTLRADMKRFLSITSLSTLHSSHLFCASHLVCASLYTFAAGVTVAGELQRDNPKGGREGGLHPPFTPPFRFSLWTLFPEPTYPPLRGARFARLQIAILAILGLLQILQILRFFQA